MEKDKIIEEMCKNFKCCVGCEMFNGFIDDNDELKNCSCAEHSDRYCTQCYISTNQAKTLYNAGYRKIPDGSVVLDRHEHQKYCAYKIIKPQIKGCLDRERELEKQVAELEEQRDRQAYIAEDLIQEKHRWTEQARKETAKEIFRAIDGIGRGNGWHTYTIAIVINKLKELAKQYGVEE